MAWTAVHIIALPIAIVLRIISPLQPSITRGQLGGHYNAAQARFTFAPAFVLIADLQEVNSCGINRSARPTLMVAVQDEASSRLLMLRL